MLLVSKHCGDAQHLFSSVESLEELQNSCIVILQPGATQLNTLRVLLAMNMVNLFVVVKTLDSQLHCQCSHLLEITSTDVMPGAKVVLYAASYEPKLKYWIIST